MAIEFTRLADVTAIEEVKDEDTVLVVQDGEVKRAPKTAVGGASTEWDAVIEWKDTDDEESLILLSGDYNVVFDKIMINGEIPNIMIKTVTQYGDIAYGAEKAKLVTVVLDPDNNSDHFIVFERPQTVIIHDSVPRFIEWYQDGTLAHRS